MGKKTDHIGILQQIKVVYLYYTAVHIKQNSQKKNRISTSLLDLKLFNYETLFSTLPILKNSVDEVSRFTCTL